MLVAITSVVLIRVAGIILVIALLAAPAATAALFTRKLHTRMAAAVGVGLLDVLGGLTAAFYLDIAAGATTILFAVLVYLVCFLARQIVAKIK